MCNYLYGGMLQIWSAGLLLQPLNTNRKARHSIRSACATRLGRGRSGDCRRLSAGGDLARDLAEPRGGTTPPRVEVARRVPGAVEGFPPPPVGLLRVGEDPVHARAPREAGAPLQRLMCLPVA